MKEDRHHGPLSGGLDPRLRGIDGGGVTLLVHREIWAMPTLLKTGWSFPVEGVCGSLCAALTELENVGVDLCYPLRQKIVSPIQ